MVIETQIRAHTRMSFDVIVYILRAKKYNSALLSYLGYLAYLKVKTVGLFLRDRTMYSNIIYFYLKIEVKHGNFTPLSEII